MQLSSYYTLYNNIEMNVNQIVREHFTRQFDAKSATFKRVLRA